MRRYLSILLLSLAYCNLLAGDNTSSPKSLPEQQNIFAEGVRELKQIEDSLKIYPNNVNFHLDRLRVLYVLGVKEKEYLEKGKQEWKYLSTDTSPFLSKSSVLLLAYEGALVSLESKHALWPPHPSKMQLIKPGLQKLDSAVKLNPQQAEIRYLRLMTCYYLPFFLGRKESVREDFSMLANTLPESRKLFPSRWVINISQFVLKHGNLTLTEKITLANCLTLAQAEQDKFSRNLPEIKHD